VTRPPAAAGPVLLVVAGGAVSQAAIARTAELAAGAPVTVVGVETTEIPRTNAASPRPVHPTHPSGRPRAAGLSSPANVPGTAGQPSPRVSAAGSSASSSARADTALEQLRRTVALAMSVLENTGVVATGHIVTGSPARAVARVARARGVRVVILDQPGLPSAAQPPGTKPSFPGAGSAGTGGAGTGGAAAGGAGTGGLMAELRRRVYGTGIVVLAEGGRPGGWVSG
jgi:hypothetical protein